MRTAPTITISVLFRVDFPTIVITRPSVSRTSVDTGSLADVNFQTSESLLDE